MQRAKTEIYVAMQRAKTEIYVAMQRAFCKIFKLKRHELVPPCVTASKWMKTFLETSAAASVRVVGRKRSLRTAKNCEKLRVAVEAVLQTSLCLDASLLCFLLSTAHRMLKHDLRYHL